MAWRAVKLVRNQTKTSSRQLARNRSAQYALAAARPKCAASHKCDVELRLRHLEEPIAKRNRGGGTRSVNWLCTRELQQQNSTDFGLDGATTARDRKSVV